MSNGKKLTLFALLSAVIIIAGIVMYALMGFHNTADRKTLEISYDVTVTIADKDDALATACENAISKQGLTYTAKQTSIARDTTSAGRTGDTLLSYTFANSVDTATIEKAAAAIRETLASEYAEAEIYVSVHSGQEAHFYEAAWRAAVALAVVAVVALIYAAIRYGFANAITACIVAACGALMSAALFAIIPIPVYAYSPALYAGFGAVVSLLLWFFQSAKMRLTFKDPTSAALSAEEAIKKACRESRNTMLLIIIPLAVVFVIVGAVAAAGVRMFFLPALLPLAVSAFAAMLLGPAVLVPLKGRFDRMKSNKRYVGKKKAGAEE